MSKEILRLEQISKSFQNVKALSGVDLVCREGMVHVLLGGNGAGKSTLIGILGGLIKPDAGAIYLDGKKVSFSSPYEAQQAGIILCTQELQVFSQMTIEENLFIGTPKMEKGGLIYKKKRMQAKELLKELALDLDPSRKLEELSLAEKFLIQFGRTLLKNPRVLIVDELTDVLTQVECENVYRILRRLAERGTAVVFITHRIHEMEEIGDDMTVLRDGKVVDAGRIKKDSYEILAEEMLGAQRIEHYPKLPVKKGHTLLRVQKISNGFIENISFELKQGEIFGVGGLVGSGRTKLLQSLVGLTPIRSGSLWIRGEERGTPARIGYLPENRDSQGIFWNMSVIENITVKSSRKKEGFFFLHPRREALEGRNAMERLGLQSWDMEENPLYLSGGNRQKVLAARNLYAKCRIYIFDEPTKGVDMAGKVEIYNIMNELARKGAGIIMASSDFSELSGMCDRMVVQKKGRMAAELTREEMGKLRLYQIVRDG